MKGSPEAIREALAEVPSWYDKQVQQLMAGGGRILALAYRVIHS